MVNASLFYRYDPKMGVMEKEFIEQLEKYLIHRGVVFEMEEVTYQTSQKFNVTNISMRLEENSLFMLDSVLSKLRNEFLTIKWTKPFDRVIHYGYLDFAFNVHPKDLTNETSATIIAFQSYKMAQLTKKHYEIVNVMVHQQNELRSKCIESVNTCHQLLDRFKILDMPKEIKNIKEAVVKMGGSVPDINSTMNPLLH